MRPQRCDAGHYKADLKDIHGCATRVWPAMDGPHGIAVVEPFSMDRHRFAMCNGIFPRIVRAYKRRNEVERLFRQLKGFRRVFSRFDKLDVIFGAFINFALIVDSLR